MEDRSRVRGALWRGLPIELVVEDGFDRAIGLGADRDGAFGRGLDALDPIRAGKTDDAETGAIALLGMGPRLQNLLAERGCRRADLSGVLANALDRPARIASMAGGHVLGNGRVLAVAADPQMDGDALAFAKISTPRTVSRASTSARAKR